MDYPLIYNIKTVERHTIGGTPDLEAVYRKLHRIGKLYDQEAKLAAIQKMTLLREKYGANWENHWDEEIIPNPSNQ